ncbi:SWI/SNF complex component SNF12 homolog [Vigna unguiculata]|uniref:SWI/SNF-related matrix-associated actin-dependent regulator of chromatin subfamily D n=1 Tax=Vigna unguiculata TaxID=3917 RepID=A0A4D6LWE1_VIGUN|nr:SWI/SNF complex component SNF12 homolog [Vigna unguiculata]XP_027924345.1 SWI/SNF complex component SNF12 homolog [Vigna unguiculata]QCD92741.1 SWI/SNF-related matrix-associated actin-dependent regulator of chromatin subfamily D [Vigna unguiculata]
MSVNNNNPSKGIGASSSSFGNAGIPSNSIPANHGFSQSQGQGQIPVGFQGQFPLSQAHAIVQAQSKAQAQAQAHAQAAAAAHAQIQAHLQAQGLSLNQNQGGGLGSLGLSSAISTPGNASGKRIPLKPPIRPVGFSPPNSFSPLRPMELTPASRRKKQKLPEKQLQDKVAAILPESALYTQLLEFESRVDAALARKKADIQEALKNPPCIQKTLRIYVFNTFANQIRTIPKKPTAEPPTWTLKIVGRILEDGVDPDQPGVVQKSTPLYPKFSAFFKRVTISLDQRLYPDNHIIMWENARSPAPHEGFEVKRKGDKEFAVNIRLEMNYVPEKFKLSPALTEVLGIEVDTRPRIVAAIWHYVKARKLQNPNDPSFFHCDQPLQKVFGEEKMKFTMVSQKISSHLFPPQPILLEHKIKLSGNSPVGTACYDVLVDVPFPIQRELSALLANVEKNKEIETCDEAICGIIRKIHEHRRRRSFFLGFSQSPVEFINALIESQSRDLKIVSGEPSRNAEKERRSDFFNQPWVEDAVIRYLNRKPAVGSDAPGST